MLLAVLTGCTKSNYRSALPANSMLLMSVDVGKTSEVGSNALLKALLMVSNKDDGGIDVTQKVYFFETADGHLGLCAAVRDADHLVETITALANKGKSKVLDMKDDAFVSVLDGSWVLAFDDDALLVAGPVAVAEQQQMQSRLVRYLSQEEERSGASSQMFQKLDSIDAPMALVAQLQALPQSLVTPFMLGAPRDADPSQVLLAAGMKTENHCLLMSGHTFSFNKSIDASLRKASQVLRPINGRYLPSLSKEAALGLFVNVEGTQFLPLMQQNAGLQTLLAGINSAIDMNNIVKSVDGDMAITIPVFSDNRLSLAMAAELSHSQWLADVDYWKASCPKGGRILAWGIDSYAYQNGADAFFFGVKTTQDGKQFYSGTTSELASASLMPAQNPMSAEARKHLEGATMGMVVNLNGLVSDDGLFGQVLPLLNSLLGDVNTIAYKNVNRQ